MKNLMKLLDPTAISHIIETQRDFNEQIQSISAGINSATIDKLTKVEQKYIDDYKNSLLKHLPDPLLAAATRGWSPDLEMTPTQLRKLGEAYNSESHEEIDHWLIEYYRSRLPEIESSVCGRFPNRKPILEKAFTAHSRCDFELSVPIFLIQADGICWELIKINLYSKDRNGFPKIKKYVESNEANSFRSIFLYPLTENLPINYSKKDRDQGFSELNRHQVLHGEAVDYGIELNSLKSISLLNYIVKVLDKQEDHNSKNQ